jgi:hypothetical protein
MKYYYGKYIQDGKLDSDCGRIVIYDGQLEVGIGPGRDHNDLLRALAAKMVAHKDDVICKGVRLYYKREPGRIIVSPVRKIDDDMFQENWDWYRAMIKKAIKR